MTHSLQIKHPFTIEKNRVECVRDANQSEVHREHPAVPQGRWSRNLERGGSLVDSVPFIRRFESRSSRHVGTLTKSFARSGLRCFSMKLRHSIPCCVGSTSE